MRRKLGTAVILLAFAVGLGASPASLAAPRARTTGPEAAARLKSAGDEYRSAGNLEAALEQYRRAVEADPKHVPSRQEFGRSLYAREQFKEAAAQFQALLELNPEDVVGWYNLGYALGKQGDHAGAASAFEKYIAANPGDPDGYYALAESLRASGQEEAAAAQFEVYVQKETRPEEQVWIEKAKSKSVSIRSALAARQPAVRPKQPDPAQPVVVAQTDPAQPAVAAPAQPTVVAQTAPAQPAVVAPAQTAPAQPAVVAPAQTAPAQPVVAEPLRTRDPTAAIYKIREGDQMFQQKRFREALSSYEDAVRLDDQSTNALLKMGLAQANLNDFKAAVGNWERVLQLDPGNKYASAYIERARPRLADSSQPTSPQPVGAGNAVAQPQPASTAPAQPSVDDLALARDEYRKAVALINQSRFAESLGPLETSIARYPGFVNAYVARGGAYLGLRRYPESAADYQKALALNPDLATPLYGLGRVYERLGDKTKAIEFYRRYAGSKAQDAQPKLQEQALRAAAALGG